jgi:hypothetical protein
MCVLRLFGSPPAARPFRDSNSVSPRTPLFGSANGSQVRSVLRPLTLPLTTAPSPVTIQAGVVTFSVMALLFTIEQPGAVGPATDIAEHLGIGVVVDIGPRRAGAAHHAEPLFPAGRGVPGDGEVGDHELAFGVPDLNAIGVTLRRVGLEAVVAFDVDEVAVSAINAGRGCERRCPGWRCGSSPAPRSRPPWRRDRRRASLAGARDHLTPAADRFVPLSPIGSRRARRGRRIHTPPDPSGPLLACGRLSRARPRRSSSCGTL